MSQTARSFVRLFALAVTVAVAMPAPVGAEPVGSPSGDAKVQTPKAVRDAAFTEFNQLRRMPATKDGPALRNLVSSGLTFLTRYPESLRAPDVVNGLAFYANGIEVKRPEARATYVAHLKGELAAALRAEGPEGDARVALLALTAAVADYEVRAAYNADNLTLFRGQIDVLAGAPAASRFLVERERSYGHVLSVGVSLAEAGAHFQKLLVHHDPAVVVMARTELNLVEVQQVPLQLQFTAWDGRPVDAARLRGRVVVVYVWSTGQKGPAGSLAAVRTLYDEYRRRGLEVVSVCVDPAENRAKVEASLQANPVPWPVQFDGLGFKHPLLEKLNLSSAPALLLLDQKGFLQHAMQGTRLTVNLAHHQVVAHTRRLLVIR